MKTTCVLIVLSVLMLGCNSQAQRGLNDFYNQNYNIAFNRFYSCAQQGDDACMNNVGMMFESGKLVGGVNIEAAIKWYTLSAKYGQPVAQQNLMRLNQEVPPVQFGLRQQNNSGASGVIAAGLLGVAIGASQPSHTTNVNTSPSQSQPVKVPINCTSKEVFGTIQTTCQ